MALPGGRLPGPSGQRRCSPPRHLPPQNRPRASRPQASPRRKVDSVVNEPAAGSGTTHSTRSRPLSGSRARVCRRRAHPLSARTVKPTSRKPVRAACAPVPGCRKHPRGCRAHWIFGRATPSGRRKHPRTGRAPPLMSRKPVRIIGKLVRTRRNPARKRSFLTIHAFSGKSIPQKVCLTHILVPQNRLLGVLTPLGAWPKILLRGSP